MGHTRNHNKVSRKLLLFAPEVWTNKVESDDTRVQKTHSVSSMAAVRDTGR